MLITCVAILLYSQFPSANAASLDELPITGIYESLQGFDFQVRDTCSGHPFFMQVSARDDGWFAVYYRYADNPSASAEDPSTAYIDVFNAEGVFQYELSFRTERDLAMELTETGVNLYFYNYVIIYDCATGGIKGYRFPDGYAMENGIYTKLRQSKFKAGEWNYHCVKAMHGYTKLIRENADEKQELLSLPGSGVTLWNTVVPAIVLGISIIFIKNKRRESKAANDST